MLAQLFESCSIDWDFVFACASIAVAAWVRIWYLTKDGHLLRHVGVPYPAFRRLDVFIGVHEALRRMLKPVVVGAEVRALLGDDSGAPRRQAR